MFVGEIEPDGVVTAHGGGHRLTFKSRGQTMTPSRGTPIVIRARFTSVPVRETQWTI
jgi:hypothetical protein